MLFSTCLGHEANSFSKGAQAIARFHALGQSLPMPHWYTNAAFSVASWSCEVGKLERLLAGHSFRFRSTLKQRVVNNHTCLKLSFNADTFGSCGILLLPTAPRSLMLPSGRSSLLRAASQAMRTNQDDEASLPFRRLTVQVKMVISRRKSFHHQGL